jgi:general secretion pathway protein H
MKNGFTLIELLVVLVIISLVSAFVAPRITAPIGNLQLKTASKKIAGAMRYSRSLAVSEKESRVCFFDFDNQQMSIFTGAAFDSAEPAEVLASGPAEVRYDLPEGVLLKKAVSGDIDVEAGLFHVIFFTNGSASGGEILLTNDRGKSSLIQINFITGMVAVTVPEHAG